MQEDRILHSNSVETNRTCLIFTIHEHLGSLQEVLVIFKKEGVNLLHIESRPSLNTSIASFDFYVNVDCSAEKLGRLVSSLEKEIACKVKVLDNDSSTPHSTWFPRKFVDMERLSNNVLMAGCELESDHPGFQDPVYRQRRMFISEQAMKYRHGTPIPRIEYTPEEIATWGVIFENLTKLYPTHSCDEYNRIFPLLVDNCGYRKDNIPQLEDVSRFLHDCTGFTLRPVAGLLSSRDFLNGLAFRVFHSTQFLRHHSCPLYTPEPDVCHELLGHAPLFADPAFANFSQEIGLASLGVSDEELEKLATMYWFTVEFGICRQGGKLKAYGAGLLSSFGELEYCLSDAPQFKDFEPEECYKQKYPITQYQPVYFVADSFESAQRKVREYASKIPRKYDLRYNPYTESIEVLDNQFAIQKFADQIRDDMIVLNNAMIRLNQQPSSHAPGSRNPINNK
eukprot:Sdes_comp20047_c0_seq1m12903